MALSDHAWPTEQGGRLGPFVASDDDVFIVGHGGTTAVEVLRSGDGGATFGTPVATTAGRNVQAISATQSGDTLYVCWATVSYPDTMTTRYDLEYQEFSMSSNTWSGSVDTVDSPDITDQGMGNGPDIARRTSDTVIIYTGAEHADMGSGWRSVVYARGTAGSWATTGQAVAGNAGSVNWTPGIAIVGSQAGECHFIWHRPTATIKQEAKTLDSANSLSTLAQSSGSPNVNAVVDGQNATTWDDAGTQRIAIWTAPEELHRWNENATTDDIEYTDAQTSGIADDGGGGNFPGRYSCAVDPTSDDVYVLFRNATPNFDLYYDKAADAASGGWGTDVEIEDAITAGSVSANGFTYPVGGSTVIAYIVEDTAGNTIYGEIWLDKSYLVPHMSRAMSGIIVQ